jgi:predicted enzyme related to lactoylglutathione lyase
MTEARTVSSEVEVGVEPDTAFTAFTAEMDLWWVRGPINFMSEGGRVVAVRCEPGVGGRIMEVLDGPDVFERARITLWEPPGRLGWSSSVDDVQTEVRFDAVAGGTRVTVEHTIPAGGSDRGGTSWSRVVPNWFAAWCAKRDRVPHQPVDLARVAVAVSYERPAAAGRFLRDVFGFEGDVPDGPDPLPSGRYGHPWIEVRLGTAAFLGSPRAGARAAGPSAVVPWVYVDDLDEHFAHVKGAGATIVEELRPLPGSRLYVAEDPEGNRWTFLQARPTMR